MRILLLTPRYPRNDDVGRNGLAAYARLAAHALRDQGAEVVILAFHEPDASRHGTMEQEGITVHRVALPWTPLISRLFPNLLAGWALHRQVNRLVAGREFLAIEVPNVEGIGWSVVKGSNRWLRLHSPFWEWEATGGRSTSWRERWSRWLDRFATRRATHLITHAHRHAEAMRLQYDVGNRPMTIVAHGVPDPGAPDHSLRIPGRILAIGLSRPRKGADLLFAAFDIVASAHPEASLTIVGSSPDPAIAEWAAAASKAWPGRLQMAGRLDEAALEEEWRRASVVVVASRYESFGLVVIEAMAREIAVVTSDAGALPEVGGEATRTFESGNAGALADALLEVLTDTALRDRLATAGRIRYLERYQPATMGRRLLEAFQAPRTVR